MDITMCGGCGDEPCDLDRKKQHMQAALQGEPGDVVLTIGVFTNANRQQEVRLLNMHCERVPTPIRAIHTIIHDEAKNARNILLAVGMVRRGDPPDSGASIGLEASWKFSSAMRPKDPHEASSLLGAFATALRDFLRSLDIDAEVAAKDTEAQADEIASSLPILTPASSVR